MVGICFSLGWGERQQLQNNKSITHQNAAVLKHFVSLSFVSGGPFVLPEDRLFIYFLLFCKNRFLQHSCSNNARCSSDTLGQHNHPTCSPTCPPDLWSISFRSLWGWTVTQVLDPAPHHSLLLFEDFTDEVPPWTSTCPPSATPDHLNGLGASDKPSKESPPSSLAVSLFPVSCPRVFLLSFSLSIQNFPSYEIQPHPDPSLISSLQLGNLQLTLPKAQFLF